MVGLHIRNVFDAPRDQESNVSAEGRSAMEGASKEYGGDAALKLLQWRRASFSFALPARRAALGDYFCAGGATI